MQDTSEVSRKARSPRLRVVAHGPEHAAAVEAFNARMREGGSTWGFYVAHRCSWLPQEPDRRVWRSYYLALEDHGTVRGGYALKPQPWWIQGAVRTAADWQGPFSEGAVNPRHGAVTLRMVRDMVKRQPRLYCWGHGRDGTPVAEMLRKLRWLHHPTPLCVYVNNPARFLRQATFLRTGRERALALDALARSGLGTLGLTTLQRGVAAYARWGAVASEAAVRSIPWRDAMRRIASVVGRHLAEPRDLRVEVVPAFGPWADVLWERHKDEYSAVAVRDADIMNCLLPEEGWPRAIRLRMVGATTQAADAFGNADHTRPDRGRSTSAAEETVGWAAVMDTQMQNDARFGDLRVGSIIDCFGPLAQAPAIVRAAKAFLRDRGVDVILSNQSHPRWIGAFAQNGFLLARNRRTLVLSPEMQAALEPFEVVQSGLHMTNLDGHGPTLL